LVIRGAFRYAIQLMDLMLSRLASINGGRLSDISAAVLDGPEYRSVDQRVTVSISTAIPTC